MDTGCGPVRLSTRLAFVFTVVVLLVGGCAAPAPVWGDDPAVLDAYVPLGESPLWEEQVTLPAVDAPCNVASCQNVLSGRMYSFVGDADRGRRAAVDELLAAWIPLGGSDPYADDVSQLQLRSDIAIDTTSGTAYMWLSFTDELRRIDAVPLGPGVGITLTSDDDPNWTNNAVLRVDTLRFVVPPFAVLALVVLAARRTRRRGSPP